MAERSFTVTLNPELSEDIAQVLFDKIRSIDGVHRIEKNGLEVGELISLSETEPQWMKLMNKMLDVMMQQGYRPEVTKPEASRAEPSQAEPIQSIGFDEREYAKEFLASYLSDGPKPEPLVWINAAELNPPLTVRSVMDASVALSVTTYIQQDDKLNSVLCWQLRRQ